MPKFEITSEVKDHWWSFWDLGCNVIYAPDLDGAIDYARKSWRKDGTKYFRLISAKKVDE